MKKEIAIVYLAAGISSRFGGKIKQFAKIGPKRETLIEYSLNQAIKAGFNKIVFIVGNTTEKPFKDFFQDSYKGIPVSYALQYYNEKKRDKPWGTTDAVASIKKVIDCPFVVCNGDDIYGENSFKILYNHLQNIEEEEATLGFKLIEVIPDKGKTNRGIFKVDKEEYIQGLKEEFNIEKSNLKERNLIEESLCSMNIFALHSKTLDRLSEGLDKFKEKNKDDRRAECLLPEEISNLIKKKKIKMKIYPASDKWLGITNPEDEEKVREMLKKS